MVWECMGCLFLGVDIFVRNLGKLFIFDKREISGVNIRTEMNFGLNKRGMKFVYVNVVILLGYFVDVDVLFEKIVVDVFVVIESRLDCIIFDG